MKKFVLFVKDHLVGEKNGRKIGKMSNIVKRCRSNKSSRLKNNNIR